MVTGKLTPQEGLGKQERVTSISLTRISFNSLQFLNVQCPQIGKPEPAYGRLLLATSFEQNVWRKIDRKLIPPKQNLASSMSYILGHGKVLRFCNIAAITSRQHNRMASAFKFWQKFSTIATSYLDSWTDPYMNILDRNVKEVPLVAQDKQTIARQVDLLVCPIVTDLQGCLEAPHPVGGRLRTLAGPVVAGREDYATVSVTHTGVRTAVKNRATEMLTPQYLKLRNLTYGHVCSPLISSAIGPEIPNPKRGFETSAVQTCRECASFLTKLNWGQPQWKTYIGLLSRKFTRLTRCTSQKNQHAVGRAVNYPKGSGVFWKRGQLFFKKLTTGDTEDELAFRKMRKRCKSEIRQWNIRKQATILDLARKNRNVLFKYMRHRRRNKPSAFSLRDRNGEPTSDPIVVSEFYRDHYAGERQLLNDKNKTDPGNLGKSLAPVYQSVNPCICLLKILTY
ncbi:hypothetical protein CLF_105013 [Clonorchis sinensis]|uniref:Uncharacterized protein n=1 Tax=Clonorchis sinensis TaxID=79923 RepID=G7YCS7_CLOSI|nr:hypothetical protein CLF_105013 [Clonorchis sinensis]